VPRTSNPHLAQERAGQCSLSLCKVTPAFSVLGDDTLTGWRNPRDRGRFHSRGRKSAGAVGAGLVGPQVEPPTGTPAPRRARRGADVACMPSLLKPEPLIGGAVFGQAEQTGFWSLRAVRQGGVAAPDFR